MLKTDQHDSELAIILAQPDSDIAEDVEPPENAAECNATDNDANMLSKGVEEGPARRAPGTRIRYPLGSRLRKEEGKVVVRVKVDASGRARSLAIVESSGHTALDQQALKDLRRARYYSARDGAGEPCAGELTIPVIFRLRD
jgi:protein TonB